MAAQLSAARPGELLALLRQTGGLTRQELLVRTGMSRSTLVGRLHQLEVAGLVHEAKRRSSTGGRPASVVAFDATDRVVSTIDIGHHRATVSLCDLEGSALAEECIARDEEEDLPALIERLSDLGRRQVAGAAGVRLMGVGVAIPAPVNRATGVRMPSVALPDTSYPMVERLSERFGSPVSVENDARALALGAATEIAGMNRNGVLVGVKFSTGVGVGLIADGRILRGFTGAAGDLGHLTIAPGLGPECTCGRRGCLAAHVSGRALVRDLARPGVRTVSDVAALYDAGDAEVADRVHEAARVLGTHVGAFVQVSNPQFVAFGGILGGRAPIAERIIESIAAQLSERISNVAEYHVVSGDHITAHGLVALVVEDVLDPANVDRQVSA